MVDEIRGTDPTISTNVLETIAAVAAAETKGVTGMGAGPVGATARRSGRDNRRRGVEVRADGEGQVTVRVSLTVAYGERIPEVGERAIRRVSDAIHQITGIRPEEVLIRVEGVTLPGEEAGKKIKIEGFDAAETGI